MIGSTSMIEAFRVKEGDTKQEGMNGTFHIPLRDKLTMECIAHDGEGTGWEHVAVSAHYLVARGKRKNAKSVPRTPNREELETVKRHFWRHDEEVFQLYPPDNLWPDNDPKVVHLWRPTGKNLKVFKKMQLPQNEMLRLTCVEK
jgi:hypothetical protein